MRFPGGAFSNGGGMEGGGELGGGSAVSPAFESDIEAEREVVDEVHPAKPSARASAMSLTPRPPLRQRRGGGRSPRVSASLEAAGSPSPRVERGSGGEDIE